MLLLSHHLRLCVYVSLRELRAVQHVFPTCGARVVSVGEGRGYGGGARAVGYFRMWRGRGHEPPRSSTQHCTPRRPVPHQRREQATRYSVFLAHLQTMNIISVTNN